MSQQSDQAKQAQAPRRESDANTSTDAAATRLGNGEPDTAADRAKRERQTRDAEARKPPAPPTNKSQ